MYLFGIFCSTLAKKQRIAGDTNDASVRYTVMRSMMKLTLSQKLRLFADHDILSKFGTLDRCLANIA